MVKASGHVPYKTPSEWKSLEKFTKGLFTHLETNNINAEEAKIACESLRDSLKTNRESSRVAILNLRYTFAHHPKYKAVPKSIENLISFLCPAETIHWDAVVQTLDVIWREE